MIQLISGSASALYPAEILFGLLHCEDDSVLEIPIQYPTRGEWGEAYSSTFEEPKEIKIPRNIDIVYLSVIELKFYSLECNLPFDKLKLAIDRVAYTEVKDTLLTIIIGMAPYGIVALWVETEIKTILISTFSAVETDVPMAIFRPSAPNLTLKEICMRYIDKNEDTKKNYHTKGVPPKSQFNAYMQQFTYRYLPLFAYWDENKSEWTKYEEDEIIPEFDYIEEALFDGTHDKLHDGGLMNYHQAGKPKKLAMKWHIKKQDYTAYFWFEDEEICKVFDRFYGAHPGTKTDFMIRIDAEQNKYELALYRYGLKEPQVINESAYQLLVFKNKFECYRSENYNQPKGAWIW